MGVEKDQIIGVQCGVFDWLGIVGDIGGVVLNFQVSCLVIDVIDYIVVIEFGFWIFVVEVVVGVD